MELLSITFLFPNLLGVSVDILQRAGVVRREIIFISAISKSCISFLLYISISFLSIHSFYLPTIPWTHS